MSYLLNNTSAQDLDSTIRCAIGNNRPFEIERLQASLDNERKSTGARKTIIKLLEREIPPPGEAEVSFDALFDGSNAHLLPCSPARTVELLKHHNAWRRGDESLEMLHPAEIGIVIDVAVELIERGETYAAQAKRLAMELECLLLDCKDTAAVSKWWDSAHDALDEFRKVIEETRHA